MASRNRRRRIRTILSGAAASVALAVTSVLASGTPASANAGSCQTPLWGLGGDRVAPNVCVHVETGWKNSGDHTEWVGHVVVDHGRSPQHKLEMWGDGFYYSGYGEWMEIYVDKRVRNGTHVCGAVTDPYNVRAIACIDIRV